MLFWILQQNTTNWIAQAKIISYSSRGWESMIEALADLMCDEDLLPSSYMAILSVPLYKRRGKGTI